MAEAASGYISKYVGAAKLKGSEQKLSSVFNGDYKCTHTHTRMAKKKENKKKLNY